MKELLFGVATKMTHDLQPGDKVIHKHDKIKGTVVENDGELEVMTHGVSGPVYHIILENWRKDEN